MFLVNFSDEFFVPSIIINEKSPSVITEKFFVDKFVNNYRQIFLSVTSVGNYRRNNLLVNITIWFIFFPYIPSCFEYGEFGLEGEIERLRSMRFFMDEIVRLRNQHHTSREQLLPMENRLQVSEKKYQQMMSFLSKAHNQTFIQQYLYRNTEEIELQGGRRKRRQTTFPNIENLQQNPMIDAALPTEEESINIE